MPLVISGPGIPAEIERGDLVSNVDVTATIIDLAGVNAGLVLDGKSLRPLWSTSQYGPPFDGDGCAGIALTVTTTAADGALSHVLEAVVTV